MAAVGTVEPSDAEAGDTAAAITRGQANRRIRAPGSLSHRYYREDFGYGLVPLMALARIAGVDVNVAASLLRVAEAATGEDLGGLGLTAERLGIGNQDVDGLLTLVRGEG
ncbi:MAG: NAD/NADP octopine/nopaline dehydrogenase family protein [Actinobacteria bacterium]|nr:NAD/NADP octopine/nopaline dehydrogenase family protein [Actinomycetota bacterium]